MDCKQAQNSMDQYLNNNLSDNDLEAFISHVKGCASCREDLEIYYVIEMAAKYLEEDDKESYDIVKYLNQDMDDKLQALYHRRKNRKVLILLFILVTIIWLAVIITFLQKIL